MKRAEKDEKDEDSCDEDGPKAKCVTGNKDEHKGFWRDWRDYDPYRYGGEDPYAHCKFPEDTENLDTPEYQALSAICKEELIWQKILEDGRKEKFYVGPEFNSLFN